MGSQTSVTESVVTAVADAEDTNPVELPPLYHTIDTDALDAMFAPQRGFRADSTRELSFHYSNSVVTIDGDQSIDVAPRQPLVDSTTARQRSD